MLLSIDSGLSAMEQFQQQLNVTANNIANVNTVGFKSANMEFSDIFNQNLGSNAAGSLQVGGGVATASITNNFSQGSFESTGVASNMAISGSGFFVVKDPTSGNSYATRDGDFTVDSNGYLVTSTGMRVQGYTNSGLSTLGDIRVNNSGAPGGDTSAVQSYSFSNTGTLTITLADGTSYTGGQVLLQNFTNPDQLTSIGNNLYSNLSSAGPLTAAVAPNSSGVGSLETSSLEMSNVDLASQLTSLITTQSAYQANSKVISTSDNVLQTIVNMVH